MVVMCHDDDVAGKLLSFEEWMRMLKDLHFLDEAFQQREGTLCFVFSRMRCVDEESERGKKKIKHLSFEDFLEAMVRVSTMKALPTHTLTHPTPMMTWQVRVSTMKALPTKKDLEIAEASDAGTFMVELRANIQMYDVLLGPHPNPHGTPHPLTCAMVTWQVQYLRRGKRAGLGRAVTHAYRGLRRASHPADYSDGRDLDCGGLGLGLQDLEE